MSPDLWPSVRELREAFAEELAVAGGAVKDVYEDGGLLVARGVLPAVREVAPRDGLQGGVAMRANEQEVFVHPFVFRQVCTNGAIFAQTLGTCAIDREECEFGVLDRVRDAVRECCGAEAFKTNVAHMAASRDARADLMLHLMPFLSRMTDAHRRTAFDSILRQFHRDKDRSRFGLVNAVTATARDTRDPEKRWRLEELGGAIAATVTTPDPRRGRGAAVHVEREGLVAVPVG